MDTRDYQNFDNPCFNRATQREEERDVWRQYYNDCAVYTMLRTNQPNPGPWPKYPDTWEEPIYEPPELEEFFHLLETTFKAAQASFLDKLHNFVTIPDEG